MRRARLALVCGLCWSASLPAAAATYAQSLYMHLTGVPILARDPRLAQMEDLVAAGNLLGAARIATADPFFYNMTLWNFGAVMSNVEHSTLVDTNDFIATIVGAARDDLDARTLLTGRYHYEGAPALGLPAAGLADNAHYAAMTRQRIDLQTRLVRVDRPILDTPDAAGLFSTRAWAKAHFNAGTNRRAVQYAIQEFLCTPIDGWKEIGLPEYRIRRDVDRAPGGDPANFQNTCRNCHAGMDGMAGAFARYDFVAEKPAYAGEDGIMTKMNRNGATYPEGYVTFDDSWVNLITGGPNAAFGWRGPTSGRGMNAFGAMLANAKAFSTCMARRVFHDVCRRTAAATDESFILAAADAFESDGYKLRGLFERIAIAPVCLGSPSS